MGLLALRLFFEISHVSSSSNVHITTLVFLCTLGFDLIARFVCETALQGQGERARHW